MYNMGKEFKRSERQKELQQIRRKVEQMPVVEGQYYRVPGVGSNTMIFVRKGHDPQERIDRFLRATGEFGGSEKERLLDFKKSKVHKNKPV